MLYAVLTDGKLEMFDDLYRTRQEATKKAKSLRKEFSSRKVRNQMAEWGINGPRIRFTVVKLVPAGKSC